MALKDSAKNMKDWRTYFFLICSVFRPLSRWLSTSSGRTFRFLVLVDWNRSMAHSSAMKMLLPHEETSGHIWLLGLKVLNKQTKQTTKAAKACEVSIKDCQKSTYWFNFESIQIHWCDRPESQLSHISDVSWTFMSGFYGGTKVSDEMSSVKTPVKIHQDCNVFATELSPNVASKPLSIAKDRQAYLLCMEGSFKIAGQDMHRHDSAEIKGPMELELLSGATGAYVLVFEMALTRESRRGRWHLVTSCKVLCKWIHLERKAKPFTACSILDTWWMNRLRFTCFTCFAHLHMLRASRYVLDIWWTSLNRYAKVFPDAFETVQNSSTARRHEPSRLCIGKKCLHRGCQTARWFISRGFQKKGLKEFLTKDFLVQFVATFACLRKQAERHAERLGCWTSTKTTNWSIFDDQVHKFTNSWPVFDSLSHCAPRLLPGSNEREKKKCEQRVYEIPVNLLVTTKPIACSTFQRIWSPAKFVQIAFRSHLLVSSYGPTSLWAYRPRLSAQTRMLHEIRQWSTVASCSHNIAILIPLCTDNMATP